ncbi:MAG: ComEC/Rec2 family competence protein [Chloroflexi bacterium]|nr:ComEC/Rec2 family competence protein [Chloroflexota bacterium]MYE40741.1 ComEC/Rec2 family competence protein [Chloroflexota bacterium]
MRLGLLAAAWLGGILLGLSWGPGTDPALLLAGSGVLIAVALRMARLSAFPAVLAAALLLGVARGEASQSGLGVAAALDGREIIATGQITDDPEHTATRVRFELLVSEIRLDGDIREVNERWLVYARPPDELVARRETPYFRYGDVLTVTGTPQEPRPIDGFDYPAYLAAQGITATMFAREAQVTGEGGARWRAALYAARGRLADSIERVMPYPESALGQALLLGKRESLPTELVERFRGTGAAHLLAISGLHVGVLLAVTVGAGAWLLGRQRPTYLAVAAAVIWLYALAAGASPSALRAAVMGTVYLAALGLGRPSSVLPALALAAALMTAASPNLIRQVSFQLSFAAVGGIALALTVWDGNFGGWRSQSAGWRARLLGWAASLTVVSAAATLATWPLVAANFGEVALLGVPVSLVAIPAMAPAVVTTIVAAVGGVVFEPLGELLGWMAVAPTAYLIAVVSAFPQWTVEADWVGRPLLAAWYGGLGLALLAAQPHRTRRWQQAVASLLSRLKSLKRNGPSTSSGERTGETGSPKIRLPSPYITITVAVALGTAAAILWFRMADGPDGYLHVHFLDIGQGDSILVVTPSGRQALIDGGPDGDIVSQALADTLPGGDRSLDLVVMTHLDSDHSNGLLEVLGRYTVGAVLSGPQPPDNEMRAQWEDRLEHHGIAPVEVHAGYVIELDDGVELQALNPPREGLSGDSNNDSLVMRLTYGEVSLLLAADIESEAEQRLVEGRAELQSTVLKAAHHGSKTSTTQPFLNAVSPAIAVVSAGLDNSYGHPAPAVVERLEAAVGEEDVYRTDRDGNVEIVSDGATVWVRTER